MDKATLRICLQYISAPDAMGRLARAFDLILKAAARAEESNEDTSEPRASMGGEVVDYE